MSLKVNSTVLASLAIGANMVFLSCGSEEVNLRSDRGMNSENRSSSPNSQWWSLEPGPGTVPIAIPEVETSDPSALALTTTSNSVSWSVISISVRLDQKPSLTAELHKDDQGNFPANIHVLPEDFPDECNTTAGTCELTASITNWNVEISRSDGSTETISLPADTQALTINLGNGILLDVSISGKNLSGTLRTVEASSQSVSGSATIHQRDSIAVDMSPTITSNTLNTKVTCISAEPSMPSDDYNLNFAMSWMIEESALALTGGTSERFAISVSVDDTAANGWSVTVDETHDDTGGTVQISYSRGGELLSTFADTADASELGLPSVTVTIGEDNVCVFEANVDIHYSANQASSGETTFTETTPTTMP